ncbi:MAG: hypothetical protein IT371_17180 [Deltaproteobacteria bacterium]|nr:hypothetical protein [Deltaproteobacteria bacterium]
MRSKGMLRTLALGLGALLAGCAAQQGKFQTLNRPDQLRFAACRHDVSRRICPDDPDCDVKAAELYAAEPSQARMQWLLDYGCPRDKILHVNRSVREQERGSIGMPP